MSGNGTHAPAPKEQAGALLSHVAGYASHRTISLGLRTGLISELAKHPGGMTPHELAKAVGADPFYIGVWCRSAFAAGVCVHDQGRYALSAHMDALLLDENSPGYVGGNFLLFEQYELFDRFEEVMPSGERLWWDGCGGDWIAGVARTGTPFNTRLVPDGLAQIPGLAECLDAGARIVDTACGVGAGLVRLATVYPECEVVGVDGDARSIAMAKERVAEAGVADRVHLQVSPLESMQIHAPATLVLNNISMHECRDIEQATRNVWHALEPGGWFVISDFPFPETHDALMTVPGRIMAAVQFFEAQIDDQLLPRSAYDDLLVRQGFTELGSAELTPVHALTWGRRP